MKLSLYGNRTSPYALSDIYEQLASRYALPTLALLTKSAGSTVLWPDGDYQCFYLDDLKEQQTVLRFQVRMKTNAQSRDFTDIFLSVEQDAVLNMTIQFPARGDLKMSSFVLGLLKNASKQRIEIDMLFEGLYERPYMRIMKDNFIKTQKLSEFQWIERVSRYIHVKERPEDVVQ